MGLASVMVSLVDNEVALSSTAVFNSVTVSGLSLMDRDNFGHSVAWLGDLDGAGPAAGVLAVGAQLDDTGGNGRGAVHLLFLNADGSVRSTSRIASGTTNGPTLGNGDLFGTSVAWLGDLDGAGTGAAGVLAVGAEADDAGGPDRGAVHLLFLNADGSVRSTREINSTTTNGPTLADSDRFGTSVAWLGDLDGAGSTAGVLAVGVFRDDTGGNDRGAVHLFFLNADGSVSSTSKIDSSTTNGPTLADGDQFGTSAAWLGDLDGAGTGAAGVLAVGATGDDAGVGMSPTNRGAVHLLFLNANGSVRSTREINSTTTNGPTLADSDVFGQSVAWLGDLDGAGGATGVLAVGARGDDTGGSSRGAVHLLFLNANGSISSTSRIASGTTNGPTLADNDEFGHSVAWLGDLDGAGGATGVLAVGATGDDTGGTNRGAVHLLFTR